MDVTILQPADLPALLAVEDGLFDHPVDPAQAQAFLQDPLHRIAVARSAGRILAFASGCAMLHPDKPPAFFVNEVGTREECRRQGLASAVLRALIAEARAMGCQGIWLGTEPDNSAARGLYRRLNADEVPFVGYGWDGAFDLD